LIGAETCEELWCPIPKSTPLLTGGAHIILNQSGSHFSLRKLQYRKDLIRNATVKTGGLYLYSNLRGCDGCRLYFDGASMIALNG
jgi:NAD+ synthase (glutamine-hydrolysing)